VFCKKSDSPQSLEDVVAKWMFREYNGPKAAPIYRTDTTTGITTTSRGNAGLLTLSPCRRCNNGWMSVLENRVKPIFSQLMRGQSLALKDSDQLTISKWMLKTAMMYEQAKGGRIYFNAIDRTNLYQGVFPMHMNIWAARFVGDVKHQNEST